MRLRSTRLMRLKNKKAQHLYRAYTWENASYLIIKEMDSYNE